MGELVAGDTTEVALLSTDQLGGVWPSRWRCRLRLGLEWLRCTRDRSIRSVARRPTGAR